MFFWGGLTTRSQTWFLWNWLSSSHIATIHPSSECASSTEVGSIIYSSLNIECSCLKVDLVFLGLSLFPMISSSGCEDLYLKVFLDWVASWEPSWATSEPSSSWWAYAVGSTSEPSGLSLDSKFWTGSEAYYVIWKSIVHIPIILPFQFPPNLTLLPLSWSRFGT